MTQLISRFVGFLALALVMAAPAFAESAAGSADSALNVGYRALLSQLDASGQQSLRDAQRAWLSFRDKECAFRSRGRADAEVRAACVAELTQQRTAALDHQRDRIARDADSVATPGADVPCSRSVDKTISDTLVRQCLQVSPATHPPCNADNSCALIRDEIKRGCAMIDKGDAPAFCAGFKT